MVVNFTAVNYNRIKCLLLVYKQLARNQLVYKRIQIIAMYQVAVGSLQRCNYNRDSTT